MYKKGIYILKEVLMGWEMTLISRYDWSKSERDKIRIENLGLEAVHLNKNHVFVHKSKNILNRFLFWKQKH